MLINFYNNISHVILSMYKEFNHLNVYMFFDANLKICAKLIISTILNYIVSYKLKNYNIKQLVSCLDIKSLFVIAES